jgi:arylsulfatase A-like enzyme
MAPQIVHDSNAPFRGQKRSLEEGGLRMPSFVRWPGRIPAGKRSNEVIHMTDLFPTFLAAAGTAPEAAWKVDGRNVLDVWNGKAKSPDRTLFGNGMIEGGNMYAAMRGDFKFLDIGTNKFLYNLREDPQERRTVAAEYPQIFRQLQQELKAWLETEVHPAK